MNIPEIEQVISAYEAANRLGFKIEFNPSMNWVKINGYTCSTLEAMTAYIRGFEDSRGGDFISDCFA